MNNRDSIFDLFMSETEEPDTDVFKQESDFLSPLLEEIEMIETQSIQYFVRSILMRAKQFWYAPSDCTIGAVPPDEHEDGGLVRHTKRTVRAGILIANAYDFSSEEKDIVIASCLLHDVTKAIKLTEDSDELFFDPMHPYTVSRFIKSVHEEDRLFGDESKSTVMYIEESVLESIMRCIRCHLGLDSPVPETIPISLPEMAVHLADLIARNVHVVVDGKNVIEKRWKF